MELRAVERRAPTRGIRGSRDNVQREFGTPVGSLLQQPPHRLDRVRAGGVWDPRRCSTTYPGTPRPRRAVVHRLVLRQRSPPSLRMGERVPIRELSLGYRLPVHLPAIYGVRRVSPRPPRAGRRARTSEPRGLGEGPAPASILDAVPRSGATTAACLAVAMLAFAYTGPLVTGSIYVNQGIVPNYRVTLPRYWSDLANW